MNILVINCGSSSIKYKLYRFPGGEMRAKGTIERIGEHDSPFSDHTSGIQEMYRRLRDERVIDDPKAIDAIGHRVVHGGETFRQPHLIDKEVVKNIEECAEFAPLHNPPNLAGIRGCRQVSPDSVQVAVFDTAFHQTLPESAYYYPLPLEYYRKYRIRKYGFHGTSHRFVALEAARHLNRRLEELKLITCHLGNGCSITAIDRGRSVDTSMGFTPLEGLMMGTRCGDVDAAAVLTIMEKEGLDVPKMNRILNRESGLRGISGVSNDIREIKAEISRGNGQARLALEMFLYRIKKYIGAYYFVLGGADAVCFTAGIGENNPEIIARMEKEILAAAAGNTRVLVIPTDEERMIANLTYEMVGEAGNDAD
ncbi:MAG: acetate/propionate family kinase [Candidatus Omnitrophica bacterium]|nr:acetate/propionate family kinase [Candidatus Omnitrophota bacterium]